MAPHPRDGGGALSRIRAGRGGLCSGMDLCPVCGQLEELRPMTPTLLPICFGCADRGGWLGAGVTRWVRVRRALVRLAA